MLLELTNIGLNRERDAAIDASKPMSPIKYLVLTNSPALTDTADIRTLTLADINEVDRLDINESGAVERVADGTAKFHGHVQVGNAYLIRGVCVVLEDGDLYAYTAYRPESGGFDKPADLAFSFYVIHSHQQSAVMTFTYEPIDSDVMAKTVVEKALESIPVGVKALYKDKYIVLATGQSNMVGKGDGGTFKVNSKVKIWHDRLKEFQVADFENDNYPSSINPAGAAYLGSGRNNMALSFCHRLQEESQADVYLIIEANGGQSITQWSDGVFTENMINFTEEALENAGASDIDAFLWCQGEADQPTMTSLEYGNAFKAVISKLRENTWFKYPAIAACQLSQSWLAENEYLGGPTDFIASLKGEDEATGWATEVKTDGAAMHDNVHYSGSALYEIGYYKIYNTLLASLLLSSVMINQAIKKLERESKKITTSSLYKDKYIVLASGQSNMVGRGIGGTFKINSQVKVWHNTLAEFQVADFENVAYPTTCQDYPFQVGDGRNNMALAFCHRLQEESGADVYLIINGAPAQSITKWTESTYLDDLTGAAQSAIATIGGEVDTFLWCQGEADQPTMTKAQYITEFRLLVEGLKSHDWFNSPAFAACQLPQSWREMNGYTGGVDAFLTRLDGTDQSAGWATSINTDNADMHDSVHYSGAGLYEIGYERIYSAIYKALILSTNKLNEAQANQISQHDRQKIAAGILQNTKALGRLQKTLKQAGITT